MFKYLRVLGLTIVGIIAMWDSLHIKYEDLQINTQYVWIEKNSNLGSNLEQMR